MPDGGPVVQHPDAIGRSRKALYVWQRFEPLLRGRSILDVGADRCHLREYVDADASYWGIGLGGTPDQVIDLEAESLPFDDRSFDCVVCLDVLEHVANPHDVFDEVCRVAGEHVILSFPNPWGDVYRALRRGAYRDDMPVKYYGLPADRPADRHKWFFSLPEVRAFVAARAAAAGMEIVEIEPMSRRRAWKHPLRTAAEWVLFRGRVAEAEVYGGTIWCVLRRPVPARQTDRPPIS